MPKGQPSVSKEVKEQILKRIKEEGIPVAQAAPSTVSNLKLSTTGFPEASLLRHQSWKLPS